MKHIYLISLLFAFACSSGISTKKEKFNHDWEFFRVDGPIDSMQVIKGVFPSSAENVSVPHTAKLEPMVVSNQWQGTCYYKKQFELTKSDKKHELYITFEAAMNVADVWVNGEHLTTHQGGYLPFSVRINEVAKFGEENTIVVQLDNKDNATTGPKPLKILDFNTYGGIYRNVWLEKRAKTYADRVIFRTHSANSEQADVEMCVKLVNASKETQYVAVEYILSEKNGDVVFQETQQSDILEQGSISCKATISRAKLWSPQHPNLYDLTTNIYVDKQLCDSRTTQVGIRTIHVDSTGLKVNGVKTHLRGVNRHQEYPYVGYAMSDEAQYRDAYLIKQAGFDYVRGSHYPHSPAFMKACDELGIFVLDAILGWQYFGDSLFMEHALQSSRELIRRDINHPSVLAWELSINETWMPEEFIKRANEVRNQEAPWTYTAGWVKGGYDIYVEARQHRHRVDPSQPLIVSEYGDWEYYAQNAGLNQDSWGDLLQEHRTSRQPRESGEKRLLQQCSNLQEAHNDNFNTHAFADGYWVMFDYNRGYADDLEYSGISDIMRLPKFAYYFYQSQRSIRSDCQFAKPMIHIASYWEPNVSKGVRVFSNCDEVALYLDDELIGRQKPDTGYATEHLAHPPFTFHIDCKQKGRLRAEGYYKGKKVATHSVTTAQKPAGIRLWCATNGMQVAQNDLLLVHAEVIDENGTLIHNSNLPIEFTIEGGEIMNTEEHPTLGGIATILVKTKSGDVEVRASGNGVGEDELRITLQNNNLNTNEL